MKVIMKRLTTMVMAGILAASVLAGCSNQTADSLSKDGEGGTVSNENESGSGEKTLEPVTLHFYFFGDKKAKTDEVWQKIADKTKDQLNATFDIQFVAGNDYQQKMVVKSAAGDVWDMNFDGDWLSYYQMVGKHSYLPLNDLLPEYAPDLYKTYQSSGVLSAATYEGDLVALPWTMSMSFRPFFQWRKDLAEAKDLDIDPSKINTVEDVDTALQKLKAAYPDRKILEVSGIDTFLLKHNLSMISHSLVYDLNDPECKVIPIEQTEAYKEMATYAQKWQEEGIIWKDVLTDQTDHNQMIDQGLLITKWGTHEFANSNRAWTEEGAGWDYTELYSENKWTNRTPLANVACISATSENPERTLMFLNMLETDQELYDLVHYGVEGETYVLKGEEAAYPEGMNTANSNYMEWGGRWALWKPQFMRPDATYAEGFWKREAEYVQSNPNNIVSPLDGFNMNIDSIKNQISQRDQIFGDADKLINVGLAGDSDAAVQKLMEDQKAAGVEMVVEEVQKQIDQFLASKK